MFSRFGVFTCLLFIHGAVWINAEDGHDFAKRGFGSYFSNSYFDEIAAATCAALPLSRAGHVFPVRRRCSSSSKETCDQICQSSGVLKQTSWNNNPSKCIESLHVYRNRPDLLPNLKSDTDVGKVGLLVFRYQSCIATSCGPNYCCCVKR
ncbi:uncharacterized protein LOC110251028 isoform X2 [Exaiptasia diaphana]|uniref:Secreted protein n=1 Tax=Exaiptasia diaphana TaxID=2652724 RepID=A0A913Y1U8_EXADI|nr:uncharacterized protein LOC110251028 isoform X2 [Exaiptasia diaphana]KXJ23214.1 hypothetical protein AC249_AIPGENE3838 [Exaiptasia diaphana]